MINIIECVISQFGLSYTEIFSGLLDLGLKLIIFEITSTYAVDIISSGGETDEDIPRELLTSYRELLNDFQGITITMRFLDVSVLWDNWELYLNIVII